MTSKTTVGAKPPLSGAYRTVWRWHFYAGVMVLPFLLLLTLTGGLYLYKNEIDRLAYGSMLSVTATQSRPHPDLWLRAAETAASGKAVNVSLPASEREAVRVRINPLEGDPKTVFVNPYTAEVTGITAYGGITETIKQLHSLSLFGGNTGLLLNILVEIVAGWAIILCATGLYLWWPRRRQAAVFIPRAADVRRRPFWRDTHAVTGFYTAAVIIFLAVSGMPWSAVWGDRFMDLMRDSDLGRPPSPAASTGWSKTPADHGHEGLGWTMEHTVLSLPSEDRPSPSLASVIEAANANRMTYPLMVNIPREPHQAWSVSTEPDRVEDTRILYVDAGTGEVKADVGFKDFGIMAKGMEWGIMVHQGQQYGEANRLIMLAGCIGVWLLSISGVVMWWKRRPPSISPARLGAPPPSQPARYGAVLAIVMPLAILYPLTGTSLLVAILADRTVLKRLRRPKLVSAKL